MALASMYREIEDLGDGRVRQTLHMKPVAYRDNGALRAMAQDWRDSGDGTRPHIVSAAPLMISATPTGVFRLHPTRDTDVYLEIGDPVYRMGGDVRTFDFSNPTRAGNRIRWDRSAAALIYEHGGSFGKLGLLLKTAAYTLIDDREFAFPLTYSGLTRSGRNVQIGDDTVMRMHPFLAYDWDGDRNATVQVPHEFRTLAGQEYVVITLPLALDSMSRPVLDPTFESQPDATAGQDAMIRNNVGAENTNYGTNTAIDIGEYNNTTGTARTLIKFDLSSLPEDAVISSATLSLYASSDFSDNNRTARVYRQKRAWVESQATWNIYSTGNSWQTAGGFGANDCEQTDIGSRAYTASEAINEFKNFALTPTTKSDLDLGNGWLIKMDTEVDDGWRHVSSDGATASQRPKLVIEYTVPAAAGKTVFAAPGWGRW